MRAAEIVEQALAEEFVELQANPFHQLLAASATQAASLQGALDPIGQAARQAWERAGDIAAQHLFSVIQVNPDRPIEEILAMPDVRAVLRTPFDRATDSVKDAISQAWIVGSAHGLESANQDLEIAGLDPTGPPSIPQSVLNQLLDDAEANGEAARERFVSRIVPGNASATRDELRAVGRAQGTRAYAGVDVAGKYASALTKERALSEAAKDQKTTIHKVWVASISAATCVTCLKLHGTRRKLKEPFPTFGLKVYGGPLNHPPRHPNCRCRIVLYLAPFEDEKGPTLQSMKDAAQQFLADMQRVIRRRRG